MKSSSIQSKTCHVDNFTCLQHTPAARSSTQASTSISTTPDTTILYLCSSRHDYNTSPPTSTYHIKFYHLTSAFRLSSLTHGNPSRSFLLQLRLCRTSQLPLNQLVSRSAPALQGKTDKTPDQAEKPGHDEEDREPFFRLDRGENGNAAGCHCDGGDGAGV